MRSTSTRGGGEIEGERKEMVSGDRDGTFTIRSVLLFGFALLSGHGIEGSLGVSGFASLDPVIIGVLFPELVSTNRYSKNLQLHSGLLV